MQLPTVKIMTNKSVIDGMVTTFGELRVDCEKIRVDYKMEKQIEIEKCANKRKIDNSFAIFVDICVNTQPYLW